MSDASSAATWSLSGEDLVWPCLHHVLWFLSFLPIPRTWMQWYMVLLAWRYVRFFGNLAGHWLYKSKPIPEKARFSSADVTVIIPTIHNVFEDLRPSLQSILACRPSKLILVTTWKKFEALRDVADSLSCPDPDAATDIEVLHVDKANKRLQICEALDGDHVKTSITILADDDVEWPSTLMPWILAPFEDDQFGGVGTCQRVKRIRSGPMMARMWNWLGAAYIERRNFEISATHHWDGGTSCMSGRTVAYRSDILKSSEFLTGFKEERWGKYILNADDDNFVTRWLVSHEWKTWVQYERECEIETTLENSSDFLKQCQRWARSNWRSNLTSLRDGHVFRQQPWCTYALHLTMFTCFAAAYDPILLWVCWYAAQSLAPDVRVAFWCGQFVFTVFLSKATKLVGLFRRHPMDMPFLLVSILFGYVHSAIKLQAALSLNVTSWGSRADGDEHNDFRMQRKLDRSYSMTTPSGSDLIRFQGPPKRRMTLPSRPSEDCFPDSDACSLLTGCAVSEKFSP